MGERLIELKEVTKSYGRVFALDLNPRIEFSHPQLSVIQADLTTDELPGDLDLVHARLTLGHIPERLHVLTRLSYTLAPGGTLLVEDWWASNTDMVMHARSPEDVRAYHRFQHTLGRLFDAGGTDRTWARHIHGAMMAAGLTDVSTVIHATAWTGRSPGAQPGHIDLAWSSATGEYFTIEYTTNPPGGFTGIVQTNILATPPQNVVTVPATDGNRYYRLRF